MTRTAKSNAVKVPIDGEVRDRARNGRYAYVPDLFGRLATGPRLFTLIWSEELLTEARSRAPH